MQTRSRAREVYGAEDTPEAHANGAGQAPPQELSPTRGEVLPPQEQATLNGQVLPPHAQVQSPPHAEPPRWPPRTQKTIQLTQEALLALIHDASARAAAQAVAQFAASQRVNPPLLPLAEVENYPRLPRRRSRGRKRGIEDPYLPLAVAPPRRSPFAPAILAEALPAGVKVSNLSEYDGTGDPQEHLDKFYAKIDWYDLSDAAYCKVFRTTLSKRALAWFNQLPAGTISSLEQLTQRFLHHFSMNKRAPKTAAFLFTIRQKENESLRDYMQRFVEAVHEVPHVNHELLASIVQQNLRSGRFKSQ
ncbi:UNVERIFIED_CONTAM: hypothetical protein Sradi_1706800 [Sesamum radiatum]|uniref:Retrotransposon gag domain-containing protein n=1 Tax=Sesamum radiatum TaxID=300843 RepID=A0AAW2TSU6_SESRA